MKEWTFEAKINRIPWLTEQVDALLEGLDCPIKAQMQIDVAIDELLANIASYAYETGKARSPCALTSGPTIARLP